MKKVHFETTKGEIVAELFEEDAPGTVANFTGLVAGTKEWTDPKSREKVKKPFYDGLTFHRVISNFMVQFGIHADPAVSAVWRNARISPDPVRESNRRGFVTYAMAGSPESIAGLPAKSACVNVGPPLSANTPSSGLMGALSVPI